MTDRLDADMMVIAGAALLAIPILCIAITMVCALGWRAALAVWGATLIFTAMVVTGAFLVAIGLS